MYYVRQITRHLWLLAVLMASILSLALRSPARGAESADGVYLLGYQSSMAGYQPGPGVYLRDDFYVYQGNASNVPLSKHVEANARSRFITDLIGVTYVPPVKILGGQYGLGLVWTSVFNSFLKGTLVNPSFPLPNGILHPSAAGDYTGVSDLEVMPVSLGWHLGQFHLMTYGSFYAPVGSYNPNRRLNTGLGRWALDPNVAVTWLQPKHGQEVSLSMGWTFNFENPSTQYTSGQEFHLEYYLGQHLPKGFAVGLAGYIYNQMTADTGPGALQGAFHGEAIALGPCLSYDGKIGNYAIGVNARYYNEVKVINRFAGQAFFLTLSLGI